MRLVYVDCAVGRGMLSPRQRLSASRVRVPYSPNISGQAWGRKPQLWASLPLRRARTASADHGGVVGGHGGTGPCQRATDDGSGRLGTRKYTLTQATPARIIPSWRR